MSLLYKSIETNDEFHFDFLMTNMSYTYEWGNLGWIYMQVFPHNKMYVGQSINITNRFRKYANHYGSNPHHTKSLAKHGWNNIRKIIVRVPRFLMNRIESFLIEWYDLMNPTKGYNKRSGGTMGFYVSQYTRNKLSVAQIKRYENPEERKKTSNTTTKLWEDSEYKSKHSAAMNTPEIKAKMSTARIGKKDSQETRVKKSVAQKNRYKDPNERKKTSAANIKRYEDPEERKKTGAAQKGGKHHNAKPVSAFGKIFASSSEASDYWRSEKAPNNKRNFIADWKSYKKYQKDVFDITKEEYERRRVKTVI